jgi:uncharacterized membrane protein HdeD (DUF308 family)
VTTANSGVGYIRHEVLGVIRSHWVLFLLQGLVMAALGLIAAVEPMFASLAVEIFAGWLFVIAGIVGLASAFTAQRMPGYWWSVLTALLAIIFGAYLLWQPLVGVLSITLVVAAFFAAQGLTQIITAIQHRGVLKSWVWPVVGGVVNLALAAIILTGWPGTATWTLGLLFGINMFMWGVSLAMTAIECRAVAAAPEAAKSKG